MITAKEAAKTLTVGLPQIAQLIKRGNLVTKEDGHGTTMITRESVTKLLDIKTRWATYEKLSKETGKSTLNLQNYVSRNKEIFEKLAPPVRIGLKWYFPSEFGAQLKELINPPTKKTEEKVGEKRSRNEIAADVPPEVMNHYGKIPDEEIYKKYSGKFSGLTLLKIKQTREELGITAPEQDLPKIPTLAELDPEMNSREQAIALLNHDGYFEVIKGRIMDPKSVISIITIKPN